jgi:acyl-CoA thioester hydrolase
MELKQFRHATQLRVRSYEVDWQNVVHNSNYLRYFEVARIEYLKAVGAAIDFEMVRGKSKVVVVRQEIDYRAAAGFDDLLTIYTRTSKIRNSSFAMEGILQDETRGVVVAESTAVHVWLDPVTDRPQPVPEHFRGRIRAYEGENVLILSNETGNAKP